jgi:hypothetical protein
VSKLVSQHVYAAVQLTLALQKIRWLQRRTQMCRLLVATTSQCNSGCTALFISCLFVSSPTPVPADALGQIFDTSRPLPALNVLQIDRLHRWQGRYCIGLDELKSIFYCCPSLQKLQCGLSFPSGADLNPMTQLQQLTMLQLSTGLHVKTASCLASLTGLKQLSARTWELPDEALLRLTVLTGLTELNLAAVDCIRGFHESSRSLLDAFPGNAATEGVPRITLHLKDSKVGSGGVSVPVHC